MARSKKCRAKNRPDSGVLGVAAGLRGPLLALYGGVFFGLRA